MSNRCTCCSHPDRKALDAAIVAGSAERAIAGRYGVSRQAVQRHKPHIAQKVAKAAAKEGRTLQGLLDDSHRRVTQIIKRSMAPRSSSGDEVALKALKERRELAALEFGTKSKVEISADVASLSDAQIEAELAAALETIRSRGQR